MFAVNVNGRFETRAPCASVPIRRVEMTWRDQGPHLLCEWAVLKSVSPQYSLYYPQYESYVDDTFDYTQATDIDRNTVYRYGTFPLPDPFQKVVRSLRSIRINEVPSLIIIRCELAESDRNRFDWMDVRAYISNIKFKLNERPDLTSNVPDIVGYRWFTENSNSNMTFDEWKSNCMWLISPQQMAVDAKTFTESLAKVNTISIDATIERPKAYQNASRNYREADFWPSKGVASFAGRSYTTPRFQLKVQLQYDNHSLQINSRREVRLLKNIIAAPGITGLVRDDRGLPKQAGLLAGGNATSSGRAGAGGAMATGY